MTKHLEAVNTLKYATVENAYRYRPIMRFLFEQYDKFRYYIKTEEILGYIKTLNILDEHYSEEQLYQDMKTLESWDCVISRHDKEMVYTIEDFKKKRLKFQITPLAYEIENTLKKLDELDEVLTGSLESKEFERILKDIETISKSNLDSDKNEVLFEHWITLMRRLENLKRNAANYLSHIKSDKAEQLFKTEEFLLYKEKFTDYLGKFILSMKKTRYKISRALEWIQESFVDSYIERMIEYFSTIPTIDGTRFNVEKNRRLYKEKWMELRNWFVKRNDYECDVDILLLETDKSIQIISRYALQLTETKNNARNRKEDYRKLASMFIQCDDLKNAHELAVCCFGIPHTRHIFGIQKATDTKDEEIWEQEIQIIDTAPKNRTYERSKRIKSYVKDQKAEKERIKKNILEQMEREKEIIQSLIINNQIIMKDLAEQSNNRPVKMFVRKAILDWIAKSLQDKTLTARTQYGRKFRLQKNSNQKIDLRCVDGILTLPDITFEFEEA
ncbi:MULTISPECIES: TIGR02677 family protein [Robertmurraya]|uniref:TIGR02677 family protein n=1 Tax=Robertmurraya beringensis TaxID=641660 RepID=A0ABV6KPL7_9BACI